MAVVGALTTAISVSAQVQVVESVSVGEQKVVTAQRNETQAQASANAQLFYQLQMLQEEVLRLQGVLEDQQYQLQQLKQRQSDDYMNLDRRLSEFNKPSVALSAPAEQSAGVATAQTDYTVAYKAAYELIRQGKFSEAKAAFEAFVSDYKGTPYEANGYYWLGELYIIDADTVKAKEAFKTVLTRFPGHSKYPEALYKTATLNYEQGDTATAKQQLNTLIAQYGDIQASADVIGKARAFLQKNFP